MKSAISLSTPIQHILSLFNAAPAAFHSFILPFFHSFILSCGAAAFHSFIAATAALILSFFNWPLAAFHSFIAPSFGIR